MRFLALASDFDGTLAHDGKVTPSSLEAIGRLKASGRKFILVTGRQLEELKETFPEFAVCDLIIAENGATVWEPKTREETALVEPPPARFAEQLRARGVQPLAVGKVILATWQPHEVEVSRIPSWPIFAGAWPATKVARPRRPGPRCGPKSRNGTLRRLERSLERRRKGCPFLPSPLLKSPEAECPPIRSRLSRLVVAFGA